MRVLVCGGRHYAGRETVMRALDDLHAEHGFTCVVHGAATGADSLAAGWARLRGVPDEPHPADWKREGRAAGPLRNARMLASGVGLVVAFPGGRGTVDMCRRAKAAGVPGVTVAWRLPDGGGVR